MKMNKLALVVALLIAAGPSHAAFVDNRKMDAVIEVNYRSISIDDLVADIVPRDVLVDFASPELRKKLVAIKGKGTWSQLLTQASAGSAVKISVDRDAKRVTVTDRVALTDIAAAAKAPAVQPVVAAPRAGAAAGAPSAATLSATAGSGPSAPVAKPVGPVAVEQAWDIRLTDKTIFGVMKRWSKAAGWQLMWDTEKNDFPVVAEGTYKGTFDAAVFGVMQSLQQSEYPVRACMHDDNRAVRIIHKSKRCKG